MISAKCDNCKNNWYNDHYGWMCVTDESSMESMLDDDEWYKGENGKHYCPECYSFDDDDNFVLDETRKDKFEIKYENRLPNS